MKDITYLESKGNKTIAITAIWRQHDVPVNGLLCGLAIYNSTIIDLKFPLALYKKLLKKLAGFFSENRIAI